MFIRNFFVVKVCFLVVVYLFSFFFYKTISDRFFISRGVIFFDFSLFVFFVQNAFRLFYPSRKMLEVLSEKIRNGVLTPKNSLFP